MREGNQAITEMSAKAAENRVSFWAMKEKEQEPKLLRLCHRHRAAVSSLCNGSAVSLSEQNKEQTKRSSKLQK